MSAFKLEFLRGVAFFSGKNKQEGDLVRKYLQENKIRFIELSKLSPLSGFTDESPLIFVGGRTYLGKHSIGDAIRDAHSINY